MSTNQPIIPGFYPDPSICRAGGTYYLVNSSFEYLPGLPIHASTDLVTWTPVGNALTRIGQIAEHAGAASSSIYAPTIRYHDDRFWIVGTNALTLGDGVGQFIITAGDPAGPWSDPVHVPGTIGIDPDLSWDEEGVCHLTWAAFSADMRGIASVPIDPSTGERLGEPRLLWQGTGGAHPEGPHLYRVDGWWCLLIAEGGTERGHAATVARARTLDGPFEGAPGNPILTHRGTSHPVQNTGHADLVRLSDGTWAMVYLGVRPRGVTPGFHVNGRETFLAGIDWIDGWPVVDEERFTAPEADHSFGDVFDTPELDQRWLGVGMFPSSFTRRNDEAGLVIDAEHGGPGTPLLATRVRDAEWSASVRFDAAAGAGRFVLRIDEDHGCALTFDGEAVEATLTVGAASRTFGTVSVARGSPPTLRIRVRLPEANPYWPPDEVDLIELSVVTVEGGEQVLASFDGRHISTEVAGRFTGRVVGVEALSGRVVLREMQYVSGARPAGAGPPAGIEPAKETMTDLPYRDATLPVEERVADLLSRLTLEEKAGQLTQFFYLGTGEPLPDDFDIESLPPEHRAFAHQPSNVEAAVSRGGAGSLLFVKDPKLANRLQRRAVEESRLGIPLIFGYDVIHGLRTIFPVPIGMAASWCPHTVEEAQATAAREARSVGIRWTFAPMIDIARDARWGRIIEGAGEDPVLAAAVAAAQVRGFQRRLGTEGILAGPKHFLGYGAARGGRDYDDADISDSELRNVYLPPFTAAIEAGAANVMSAYMDLNGVPASGNRWLLTEVLRGELNFEGWVVSDANAIRSLETQHFAGDQTDAAARAVNAGLDMEMCTFDPAFDNLPQAVRDGAVREDALDAAVARVLTAKFRLGLFENPYVDEEAAPAVLASAAHRDAARDAAERTIVLLKNDGAHLPLQADGLASVAVVGQLADSKRDTIGPWVFDHDTTETVTILDGVRARLGEGVRVEYAPGACIPERRFPSPFDAMDPTVQPAPEDWDDDAEIKRAVALAAGADIAVVVVGQRQNQIGEKASVSTLELPGRQLEQLQRIAATGTPVVLVVMSGRPVDLRWADGNVPAIVQVWYPGTRGGEAAAAVLFGDVSPAGRLPFTWPRHVGQVPLVYSHYRTFAPQDQGTRYIEEPSTPLYPFGHGLSYARFEYANLRVNTPSIARGETAKVSVDVTNTSDREADEVVQLYIHQRYGTSTRPVRELKGFERVTVAAGATTTVTFVLGPDQLRYWSTVTRDDVQDATTLDLWVGGSSHALTSTVLEVRA